jgi:sugar phosphate isomerase/epimerase
MQIQDHIIGVCSWSLQIQEMSKLTAALKSLGLSHFQLGLLELVMLDDRQRHAEMANLKSSGLSLTGTMMSFPGEDYSTIAAIHRTGGYLADDTWPLRKKLSESGARISAELGTKIFATHIGFVPARTTHGYEIMRRRIEEIAEICHRHSQTLLLETGQERAADLEHFLKSLSAPNVAVNFDPANMILYGAGDPIDAIHTLGPYIRHVHVKDATASDKPGEQWGAEVPFGSGEVGPEDFMEALHEVGYHGPLAIEREAGTTRQADVRKAIDVLKNAGTRK